MLLVEGYTFFKFEIKHHFVCQYLYLINVIEQLFPLDTVNLAKVPWDGIVNYKQLIVGSRKV